MESWTWHDKLPTPNSNNVMPRIKRNFGGAAAMASDAARPVVRCESPLEKGGGEKSSGVDRGTEISGRNQPRGSPLKQCECLFRSAALSRFRKGLSPFVLRPKPRT